MAATTTFDGVTYTHLLTTRGRGWVRDVWACSDHPHRPLLVVTAAAWVPVWTAPSGVSLPFTHSDSSAGWAYAVSDSPAASVADRLVEAARQERQRSLERLSEPLEFVQVWP